MDAITSAPVSGYLPDGTETMLISRKAIDAEPAPTLPDWLSAYSDEDSIENVKLARYPRTQEERLLELQVFDIVFEQALDRIIMGESVMYYLRNDPRIVNYGRFMQWIDKDADRKHRYNEAQRLGSEALLEINDRLAAGDDIPMGGIPRDIERDKMMIRQNEFKIRTWNKGKYGDTKQVDINMSAQIDVRAILDQREEQMRTLMGEFVVVDDSVVPQLIDNR